MSVGQTVFSDMTGNAFSFEFKQEKWRFYERSAGWARPWPENLPLGGSDPQIFATVLNARRQGTWRRRSNFPIGAACFSVQLGINLPI